MTLVRVFILALGLLSLAASPARAIGLIRDADIEYGLAKLAEPLNRAANLSPSQIRILLVDDPTLNAFIIDARHIFIHTGLLLKLDSPRELQAVIAHEVAHIANGHITRRAGNAATARTAAGLGLLLAAAAAAAGGGEAAAGLALGAQSSAQRLFLAHTRAEESSADITSVRILSRAGIDPVGALEVQEIFRGQDVLAESRQDPYMRTHPTSRDRLRALKGLVTAARNDYQKKPGAEYWYARIRGKLSAFKRAPKWTMRRADASPAKDIALMRKSVAYHRQSNLSKALEQINAALALRGNKDPFYLELKGQILLENRKFAEAARTYQQAAGQAPKNALVLGGYGRAVLAAGNPKAAISILETARARDVGDLRVLRDLAVAYAKTGKNGMASLVTAERYALQGRLKDAKLHATRAEALLPRGSGPWRRAQDVLIAAKNAPRR